MEDLILILVLSGIGLVTLLVSVWLFYRKKRKTTEKKRACTAECRAAIVDVGNYHARNKHRMLKAAGGVSAAHFLSGAGGTGRRAASLGVKMATLGLYYYPVYRYTYRGETYEQIGDVRQWRNRLGKRWERSLRFLSIRPNLPAFTAWRRKRITFSSALPT